MHPPQVEAESYKDRVGAIPHEREEEIFLHDNLIGQISWQQNDI